MEVGKLYKTNRGVQTETTGFLVHGAAASVQILGRHSLPATINDMIDLTDAELLTEGSWPFIIIPRYIYFVGTADLIEIVGMGVEEVELPITWGD